MKKIDVDKIWSSVKKEREKEFTRLKKRYLNLIIRVKKMEKEKKQLEKSGVEFGTPSWKTQVTRGDGTRKEYLRILYPTGERKYIGSKESKIKKALEAIKRGERVKTLESQITNTKSEIESILNRIRAI